MDKETIAILLSVFSLGIAALALGWNIYRDVYLKAKVHVTCGKRLLIGGTLPNPITHNIISATNHGPGKIKLDSIVLKNAPLWRRLKKETQHAVLIHDYTNPMSGQLPSTLEVGEKIDLLLNWDEDSFYSNNWTHVGLSDSFGRTHWAPSKLVSKANQEWREEFDANKP